MMLSPLPVIVVGPAAQSIWTMSKAVWVCLASRGSNTDKIGSSITGILLLPDTWLLP